MRGIVGPAPSSLTASARASLRNRPAARSASSSLTWYDMNGRSAITRARRHARVTAAVSISISSSVIGTVEEWPSTTIAAESPTSTRSTPARSTIRPDEWSYAVTITSGRPSAFARAISCRSTRVAGG